MTRPSSEILEDLLAVALRIERLLVREADNATVDYYVRRLSQPRPVPLPGMPDPPIAPVRPQTTWGGTAACATAHKADLCAPADNPAQWRTPPQGHMHGGWIHATGFSMVGP